MIISWNQSQNSSNLQKQFRYKYLQQNNKPIRNITSNFFMFNLNIINSHDHRPQRILTQPPLTTTYRNQSGQKNQIHNLHLLTNIQPTSNTFLAIPLQSPKTPSQQFPSIHFSPNSHQTLSSIPPKSPNTSSLNFNPNKFHFFSNNRNNQKQLPQKQQKICYDQSFNTQHLQMHCNSKQIYQKIQTLTQCIKNTQKRLIHLQQTYLSQSSSINSSKISSHNEIQSNNNLSHQKQQNIKKLKHQISLTRQQIKNYHNNYDNHKIGYQKNKGNSKNQSFSEINNVNQLSNYQQIEQIYKQLKIIKNQFDQKIRKNFDTFASIIAKLQKQMHNINTNYINTSPKYSSSGIKCTGTSILLRFVQSFKVKKNHIGASQVSKNGDIKITLMDNTYYIDNQGYLLDKDQCYLVDYRGAHVRLQDKHVKMLKQQNVLK